ncbi:MAG: hypothetical protein RJA32_1339, partial [Pseudomonadota bacterium]
IWGDKPVRVKLGGKANKSKRFASEPEDDEDD